MNLIERVSSVFIRDRIGVNEPRLLICLFGPPLLHVDLKFVSLPDLAERVEDPLVLWERDGRVSAALSLGTAAYPQPDLQWIEDRFWTWVHYTTVKIGRGELFEALDALAFLRSRVLGPLVLLDRGVQPQGLRRIEVPAPDCVAAMRGTVGGYDAGSVRRRSRRLLACIGGCGRNWLRRSWRSRRRRKPRRWSTWRR